MPHDADADYFFGNKYIRKSTSALHAVKSQTRFWVSAIDFCFAKFPDPPRGETAASTSVASFN